MAERTKAFEELLLTEVIPDVDANFCTIADARHRALAGLSMGGMQTCSIFPRYLDRFSYIGFFSGTDRTNGFFGRDREVRWAQPDLT